MKKATSSRLLMVIGVHLILRKGNRVLLARRANSGWGDGKYNLPCGHLDPDETAVNGLIREAKEEVGIRIAKKNLRFVGCTHWNSNKQSVNLFFECRTWGGQPFNAEPAKCDHVEWFDLDKLPRNIVPQSKKVLQAYKQGIVPFLVEAFEKSK